MFAQKVGFWNDYNNNNTNTTATTPTTHGSHGYPHYPYGTDQGFASYTENSNDVSTISPDAYSTGSKSYDNPHNDYIKDIIEKIADKEKYILGLEKQIIGHISPTHTSSAHAVSNEKEFNQYHYDAAVESSEFKIHSEREPETKKTSILSRFYKPDGTPLKSLWDTESALKEQRAYKYAPKPLERRKNPRAFIPNEKKTKEYWERRRKNNLAARKSREDRRKKEIEILKNVDNLKTDNLKLKVYAQKIMAENENLKYELELLKRL